MRFTMLFVLVATLALSSCFSNHPEYPAQWAALEKPTAKSCPELAGRFVDRTPDRSGARLSWLLLGNPSKPLGELSEAFEARLKQPTEGRLDVEIYLSRDDSTPMASKSYLREKGDFACESGWMLLRSVREAGVEQGVAAIGSQSIALTKSSDGFVVAKRSQGGVGVILIVPVGGSSTEWHRFSPVPLQPAPPALQPIRGKSEPVLGL